MSSSRSSSSTPLTSPSPLHTGWLQYHIHIPSLAYPLPDLAHLDGSSLPQYYFTLHPEQLDCSLNPALATDAPPLSTIALTAATALTVLSAPVLAAGEYGLAGGVDRLHYVFCLSDGGGGVDGGRRVHVLSAARRSDMEQWLTALRRCLFNIKRPNAAALHHPYQPYSPQPLPSPNRHTANTRHTNTTARPSTIADSFPASSAASTIPSSSPSAAPPASSPLSLSLSSSSASSLRQRLLLPADVSAVSVMLVGGDGGGVEDDVYARSSWDEHSNRKLCCVIC